MGWTNLSFARRTTQLKKIENFLQKYFFENKSSPYFCTPNDNGTVLKNLFGSIAQLVQSIPL